VSVQLTVSVRGEGPDAVLQRAVLATVPNDFRVVEGEGDILLVSGRDGNAAEMLASAGPATRAIMVTTPAALDAGALAALASAEAAGTPVMLGFAYVPWFGAEGLAFDAALGEEVALLDLTADVADAAGLRDALLEQLHIGRAMMGTLTSTSTLLATATATVVEAAGGTAPFKWRMTACKGLADKLTVERVSRERRTTVEIVADAPARPGRITHQDATGSHTQGPLYQSGYRVCWKTLYAALEAGSVPAGTLAGLESDLALLPA
jgi:hypothetical protein